MKPETNEKIVLHRFRYLWGVRFPFGERFGFWITSLGYAYGFCDIYLTDRRVCAEVRGIRILDVPLEKISQAQRVRLLLSDALLLRYSAGGLPKEAALCLDAIGHAHADEWLEALDGLRNRQKRLSGQPISS